MELISFVSGAFAVTFVYCLFSQDREDDDFEEYEDDDIESDDFEPRHAIMSCQTCRKQKKHKEVEYDLWQCVKCKRHTDLRRRGVS
jgi:acetyl-CoA carboxylase beta subunit